MQLPPNRFKSTLHQQSYGIWNDLITPTAAELCAASGFDWVVIDAEHAPFELSQVLAHHAVIAAYPEVTALVRPPSGEASYLKRLLDGGVQNFVIPMVETETQAEALVRATRYPPRGKRGIASALARASRWAAYPDYVTEADDQICLLAQIETVKGWNNLEEIAAVDGIDGLFIGPADLAGSMGYAGNAGHPAVVDAALEVIERARAAGSPVGILALTEELAAKYRAAGATILGVGVDLMLLAGGLRALGARWR